MNDSSVPSCCCCRRLKVGFQLFSPFGFQSRRVALSDAPAISGAALRPQSGTNRTVFGCVRTLLLSALPPPLPPSLTPSIQSVWRSGAAFASRCWRRAAKMDTGEIHFIIYNNYYYCLASFIAFHSSVANGQNSDRDFIKVAINTGKPPQVQKKASSKKFP